MYKKYFEKAKLAIFDLDGTILDTKEMWDKAICQALKDIGLDYPEIAMEDFPEGTANKIEVETILNYLKPEKKPDLEKLLASIDIKMIDIVKAQTQTEKKGFWDLMFELKNKLNVKVALFTNSNKPVADTMLASIGIDGLFDKTLYGNEVQNLKPSPEGYETLLREFKVNPQEAVAFEDSLSGVTAARKAKIPTFVIWNGKIEKKKYREGCIDFVPDFSPIYKYMNMTIDEFYFGENIGLFDKKQ